MLFGNTQACIEDPSFESLLTQLLGLGLKAFPNAKLIPALKVYPHPSVLPQQGKRLGGGAFGNVYEALSLKDKGSKVAVKIFEPYNSLMEGIKAQLAVLSEDNMLLW